MQLSEQQEQQVWDLASRFFSEDCDHDAVVGYAKAVLELRAQADARPVLWWNGIRKSDADDGTSPSFSEKEDTNHDIPLVSAVNPCNIAPVDMVLHCPNCGLQHIDEPEKHDVTVGYGENRVAVDEIVTWDNPPHRSHLCHGCGHIWRPADVPTNGVLAVKTKGQNDSLITGPDRIVYTHPEASAPGLSDAELRQRIEALWRAYQLGQVSADHTAKEVFAEVLTPILTRASAATVAEPSEVPDSVALAFHRALTDDAAVSPSELQEIKVGLKAAFLAAQQLERK